MLVCFHLFAPSEPFGPRWRLVYLVIHRLVLIDLLQGRRRRLRQQALHCLQLRMLWRIAAALLGAVLQAVRQSER